MMRPLAALALAILAGTLPGTPAAARPYQAAVFDIELLDTSQEAGAGERADQTRRLQLVSEELRKLLAASGRIALVDLGPSKLLRTGQVDIRGNTDEMWLRGIRYAVKNRLLAEPLPERP